MKNYRFTIFMDAVPKLRARKGKYSFYTPKKTQDFEENLAMLVNSKFKNKPIKGALGIDIICYLKRPKSVKRKYPIVKPDSDNYLKSICDSLNKVLYDDDCQIIDSRLRKLYADDRLPCIGINIWQID